MKYSVKVKTQDEALLTLTITADSEVHIDEVVKKGYKMVKEIVSIQTKEDFIREKQEITRKEKEELERERIFKQNKGRNRSSARQFG